MLDRPFVLIIDDEPQETFVALLNRLGVEARHVLPDELTMEDLRRASLVLIDEYIETWPGRERVAGEPGLYVRDGVALAAVLRSHLEKRGPAASGSVPSRTAIVLRTGGLDRLARGLPRYMWPMSVAGRYDLEWVAEKQSATAGQFADLARAADALPTAWNPADPEPQLAWLRLGDTPWRDDALAQIEQCRPPWSSLSTTSAGRIWLAWFMQSILPFSTFLVDDLRAAAYLGLRADALDALIADGSSLSSRLEAVQYSGQLDKFSGRRWWRSGVVALRDELLVESGGRGAIDAAARLSEMRGGSLDELGLAYPVFAINEEYEVVKDPIEITSAVRLQPDGWPAYADDPWLGRNDLEDAPDLARLVVLDDRADDSGADDGEG